MKGVQDGDGLPPGLAGGLILPGRMLGVTEVGQDHGLGVAVAELPEQVERPLVTRRGRDMITGSGLDIAQVVPAFGLIAAMTEFSQQAQGLPAELPVLP